MASERVRVVVVGHGMVAHRFCERLVELDPERRCAVTVLCEEPRPAYDRVRLSNLFSGASPEDLSLGDEELYRCWGIDLRVGERATSVDCGARRVGTSTGALLEYDRLVLATGSAPFVPPIPGRDLPGVFVYRTIEDVDAIRAWGATASRAAVIGGGLLGLEAAKALLDMGVETHVVEFDDRLMPRQVDARGGAHLARAIEALGVQVHTGARTEAIVGEKRVAALVLAAGDRLDVDLVVVSAGIRPRDELARAAGLGIAERGGIRVDSRMAADAEGVYAIGECAAWEGTCFGLVAPGYAMADTLARGIAGADAVFPGGDLSTKLKLLGIDVASFGDPFADERDPAGTRSVVFEDAVRGVYQKVVLGESGDRVLGGVLVGDASPYATLHGALRQGVSVAGRSGDLLAAPSEGAAGIDLGDEAQVCSCNDVTRGEIAQAVRDRELSSVGGVKACTRAGTGCGGCLPAVAQILEAELEKSGREVDRNLCEHFAHTRDELFWIVKLGRIESFDALLESHGRGDGCEICRPAIASILASTWNDLVLAHADIQDTNDRFLANIQRGGTYSVIPRVPGGEITADKLIALGTVARRYDLYCKITGGQRVDLLGARVEQLPEIWEELVAAGFESGHAYGKAMRTVKSCIGSTWCRFGVQDSTAFAIRVEERYRGIRAPHKLKSAVSGCIRECAEAQNKDFGIIATENGWNVYLGGNGGSNPRHGDLVATDVSDEEVIRIVDRFLMFYMQTARPLQRTARWIEELDGGIAYLKSVILDDALGINDQLEADMEALVGSYRCEWRRVVETPELRATFRHFADGPAPDDGVRFVRERDQKRPADWPDAEPIAQRADFPPEDRWAWRRVGRVDDFPRNGGAAVRHGAVQIAVYNFTRRGEWFATQNVCPHRKDNVLARGLLGDRAGEPKVACPLHKKTFSLETGKGLSDPAYQVRAFPTEVRGDEVWVKLPPAEALAAELSQAGGGGCAGGCG